MPRRPASRKVHPGLRAGLRVGVALLAVALGLLATLGRWQEVSSAAAQLSPAAVGWAAAAVLCGLFATMMSWRSVLADLGSALPIRAAMRVFFLGQLGKYLPGSVWWLVGQVELAADEGVPRRRTAAAGALALLLSLIVALLLAAGIVPLLALDAAVAYWPALAAAPVLLLGLHPRVVNRLLTRALRTAGRDPLEHPLSGRGLLAALSYATAAWVAFGLQVAVLAAELGAPGRRVVALSIGGFALAWSVGLLAVVVPAGIGVREAALVAVLAPVLAAGPALVVALLSRVLMSGADLAGAGLALLAARRPDRDRPDRDRPDRDRSDRVEPV